MNTVNGFNMKTVHDDRVLYDGRDYRVAYNGKTRRHEVYALVKHGRKISLVLVGDKYDSHIQAMEAMCKDRTSREQTHRLERGRWVIEN